MGTKAACAGGVTTVFDMPVVGEPYTFDSDSLQSRIKNATDRLWTDCGFLGGVQGGRVEEARNLAENGIFALVATYGNPQYYGMSPIRLEELDQLEPILVSSGLPLIVSCEKCDESKLKARSPYSFPDHEFCE